jgi:hypothetical protein
MAMAIGKADQPAMARWGLRPPHEEPGPAGEDGSAVAPTSPSATVHGPPRRVAAAGSPRHRAFPPPWSRLVSRRGQPGIHFGEPQHSPPAGQHNQSRPRG